VSVSNPNELTKSYLQKQLTRNISAAKQIGSRTSVSDGRVIPADGDLPIHVGRRLEATVLFLDICKFSERPSWTHSEQENLLRSLSLFFSEMIRIVEDFGGVVEKNTGDGLMAYFTRIPNDQTSSQQRAMAAALTMFSAADLILNPFLRASNLEPFDFRICLDHGPITVAQVGIPRGFSGIVAIGTTANIACKMLTDAEPNTIVIGTYVLNGLPESWREKYVRFKTLETGWYYTETGQPYAFWLYNGRWTVPSL
jgi:class 3 adenylate cyclase